MSIHSRNLIENSDNNVAISEKTDDKNFHCNETIQNGSCLNSNDESNQSDKGFCLTARRSSKKSLDLNNVPETEKMIPDKERTVDDVYKEMGITEDTKCGLWFFQGDYLQQFANKNVYVFIYGVLGCILSASSAYFSGTITMIEKRFKIPSRTTGVISVGNDISSTLISAGLSYYAGRGHRPRWIAFGVFLIGLYCVMSSIPQLLYGSGENALFLTTEYGAEYDQNATSELIEKQIRKTLCHEKETESECEIEDNVFAPVVILFIAQLISGIGGSLVHTMGVSYMDDNIRRSKTPALLSLTYFIRYLGPAIGYALAAFCLRIYISPYLTPTIDNKDPRWLGAWWLGWIVIAIPLFAMAFLIAMFPKTLPRAAARKLYAREVSIQSKGSYEEEVHEPPSFVDMMDTFKRLTFNVTYMLNNLAAVFYFFGYMPYWMFMAKYIEIQYRQSASASNMVTGTVGFLFSAIGLLLAGYVISTYKPKARYLAAWNVIVGAVSVTGMVTYAFLGCTANDVNVPLLSSGEMVTSYSCNSECNCDFVKYAPICSENGETFISACHAGCQNQFIFENGTKIYTDCKCIQPAHTILNGSISNTTIQGIGGGTATPGSCPVDCTSVFYIFLCVVCILKLVGASGRASNFLVSIRCVDEKDKSAGMGFGLTIMCLFAFMPSPIVFGSILDSACLVWGKTCSSHGNCWLYNGKALRYVVNFTAATFVFIGTIFDAGVWYYVKDLQIFDEEVQPTVLEVEALEENKIDN